MMQLRFVLMNNGRQPIPLCSQDRRLNHIHRKAHNGEGYFSSVCTAYSLIVQKQAIFIEIIRTPLPRGNEVVGPSKKYGKFSPLNRRPSFAASCVALHTLAAFMTVSSRLSHSLVHFFTSSGFTVFSSYSPVRFSCLFCVSFSHYFRVRGLSYVCTGNVECNKASGRGGREGRG